MTPDEHRRRFTEDVSLTFQSMGMPPMAGRVWAALLLADGPHLSAADLQSQIGASAGSVSTAVTALIRMGIVDRVWVPGDRRSYYAASMDALERLLDRSAEVLTQMVVLSERGIEVLDGVDPARQRLEQMRDFYAWFDREFDLLIDRWREQQQASNE